VARILVVAEKPFRIIQAVTFHGLSEKEAIERINHEDMNASVRSQALFGKMPWDKSLYDLTIYADRIGENGPLEVIIKHMGKLRGISQEIVRKEQIDFKLTAEVELALSCCGGIGHVWIDQGHVVVTIKKDVIFQKRLKRKIIKIAGNVPGVLQVDVRLDQSGDYPRPVSEEKQSKQTPVLLVDDEKRYVETLSERLKIREVETKVTYSGEDALGYLDNQDTELMVLDLKMPGIDGFEVLRQIKATKPEVEVIILTGQGSDFDRKTCLDLGAFAFLERPVDIDVLTETMRKAHEKIRSRKTSETQENN
jgi:CheY-like chemotaxis protein